MIPNYSVQCTSCSSEQLFKGTIFLFVNYIILMFFIIFSDNAEFCLVYVSSLLVSYRGQNEELVRARLQVVFKLAHHFSKGPRKIYHIKSF